MKRTVLPVIAMLAGISTAFAFNITGPDGKLDVSVELDAEGRPCYSVTLDGKTMLRQSPRFRIKHRLLHYIVLHRPLGGQEG